MRVGGSRVKPGMTKLNEGMTKLSEGMTKLSEGMTKLNEGMTRTSSRTRIQLLISWSCGSRLRAGMTLQLAG